MDGVSAISAVASIGGIIELVSRALVKLHQIKQRLDEADLTVLSLIGELAATKTALDQIHNFVNETSWSDERYFQLELDLDTTLSTCGLLMTFIEGKITSISLNKKDNLSLASRVRIALEDNITEKYLEKLHRQLNALGIVVNTFQCRTLEEQKHLLHARPTRIILNQVKDDSTSLMVLFDDASFISRRTVTTTATSKLSLRFPFDQELLSTKAYHRAFQSLIRRTSRTHKQDPVISDPVTLLEQRVTAPKLVGKSAGSGLLPPMFDNYRTTLADDTVDAGDDYNRGVVSEVMREVSKKEQATTRPPRPPDHLPPLPRASLAQSLNGSHLDTGAGTTSTDLEVFGEGSHNYNGTSFMKAFRVPPEAPCYKVVSWALESYQIEGDSRNYALYIVYGSQEFCLGREDRPLGIFRQLAAEGKKPMFMLRKHATPERATPGLHKLDTYTQSASTGRQPQEEAPPPPASLKTPVEPN